MAPYPFPSDTKGWIKISTMGFFVSYVATTCLGLAFPSSVSWFTQAFINFLGGAKGGLWTNDQIFWHVLTWNMMAVFIILVMGILALSFTYPVYFGIFVGLVAGTWCYRHGIPLNPWTLVMVPWGVHGWIEATYMILASGITMRIGTEMFGIRNRRDLLRHMFSSARPIPGWKERVRPLLKRVIILYLCIIMPAVAFGAFFEGYMIDIIFHLFNSG